MFGFLLIKKETFLIEFQTENTKYYLHITSIPETTTVSSKCASGDLVLSLGGTLGHRAGDNEVTLGRCHPSKCVTGKHTHIHNIYKMQSLLI